MQYFHLSLVVIYYSFKCFVFNEICIITGYIYTHMPEKIKSDGAESSGFTHLHHLSPLTLVLSHIGQIPPSTVVTHI